MSNLDKWIFGRIYKKLQYDKFKPYLKLENIEEIKLDYVKKDARDIMSELESKNYVTPVSNGAWKLVEKSWQPYADHLGIDHEEARFIIDKV